MPSHRKRVRRRRSRSSRTQDASRPRGSTKESLARLLSTTRRRVLALAGAVGVITGAITGVLALLPKPKPPPDVRVASFAGVTANPDVSLEQYDARAAPTIVGGARTASIDPATYRLAADTTTLAMGTGAEGEEGGHTGTTGTTPTTKTSTAKEHLGETTGTRTSTTPTTSTAETTTTTSPTNGTVVPRLKRRLTRKGAKRRGAKVTLSSPGTPYPQEKQAQPVQQTVASPPAQSLHPVSGALVSEGAGVPHGRVAAVVGLLAAKPAEPTAGANPGEAGSAPAPTSSPAPSVEGATSSQAAPAPPPAGKSLAARIVLPSSCSSRACGATQEIEKALTYDPNPVKAAQAVAAIFNDSRAEVVGRNLYPLGAEVSYNVDLKGFAHSGLTIAWSLVGRAGKRPLARPWWRDIVVAHVKPTVDEESLNGSFWVPMPPEHGDYLVKLVLLDAGGVAHASSYSTPAFH